MQLKAKITEKLVSSLWHSHVVRYPVADTGEWLHVIFPGRASNSGGDFKDAVVGLNGRIVTGDIEVHVKSSQWQSHGHHRDPAYNNIVVHIVWQQDSGEMTRLQNGRAVPTVALEPYMTRQAAVLLEPGESNGMRCPYNHLDCRALSRVLSRAGMERFKIKSVAFQEQLAEEKPEQVLYRGICRALGYAQNAEPLQQLAQRLPVAVLKKHGQQSMLQQALLLGHAGLLPSQRNMDFVDRASASLERIWHSTNITDTMKSTDWCFFRVRPDNFPTRRIVALSYMLDRLGPQGLLASILDLVEEAPGEQAHIRLEEGLTISDGGYWQQHFDFGLSSGRRSALIGCQKATAVVVNIALPFAVAFARKNADSKLKLKAKEIYRLYPSREENELTRFMRHQLSLPLNLRISACQQQGLIHLFNAYCRQRNCLDCPVSINRG